jgi:uncharacterized protein (TIGR00369 family)
MNSDSMSGLEVIQMIADGNLANPSMAETMHMKIAKVGHGSIEFKATAGENHLNPMGGVHGGFAATVLDSATGAAVHTLLAPGESYGTIDLNVKMLKPVPVGKELTARGQVINKSRRLGISEAVLKDEQGQIYAHATATCMILRKADC